MKNNKSKLNLTIDLIMFILMMIIAGIGVLIKFVLIPGFKRNAIYGDDVELYFWGLNRHQWGAIHFIISLILLFLLVLHIVFHWQMILSIFRKMVSGRQIRRILTTIFATISLLFCLGPLVIHPEVREEVSPQHLGRTDLQHRETEIEIFGSMTLHEVALNFHMNEKELATYLHVPLSQTGQRLGRLRKMYNFQMNDIREFLTKYGEDAHQ